MRLDPDVAQAFRSSEAVNAALRALLQAASHIEAKKETEVTENLEAQEVKEEASLEVPEEETENVELSEESKTEDSNSESH